jgi:hypothetical protein
MRKLVNDFKEFIYNKLFLRDDFEYEIFENLLDFCLKLSLLRNYWNSISDNKYNTGDLIVELYVFFNILSNRIDYSLPKLMNLEKDKVIDYVKDVYLNEIRDIYVDDKNFIDILDDIILNCLIKKDIICFKKNLRKLLGA